METPKLKKQPLDVLVLDDDPDLCMLMESMLRIGKFKAARFTNPDLLKSTLDSFAPSIILMDMMLSGQDGRELCRKLKTDPETSFIKIMMISADPDAETSCRNSLANDFLNKPFELNALLEKVGRLITDSHAI